MGIALEFLTKHLRATSSPYLFVGSGFSRRYADLPDWEGLLRHFAAFTDQPYEYYRGLAAGDNAKIASLVAEKFYPVWWSDERFADSRSLYNGQVTDTSSALKIEVARYFEEASEEFEPPADLKREFQLLQRANVEGIVTTNYDQLLSSAFPDYTVFTGQDELLFADPQGIAEIYMIHGSSKRPQSLVLTSEDYADFRERDAYLAAKLMTFFVEHPIVFLGYGMNDENVVAILRSLLLALRGKNVGRLKDRLLFVQWDPSSDGEVRTRTVQIDEASIDAHEIVVPDFEEVFQALGVKERALPARVLRQLKSQVYELVKSNDPKERLVQVSDIDSSHDQIDVVFGVGAKMTLKGLVALSRWELMDDLLEAPDRDLPSEQVITDAFGKSFGSKWFVPYWKHLRKGMFLGSGSELLPNERIPQKVLAFEARDRANLELRVLPAEVPFEDVVAARGEDWVFDHPWEVLDETSDASGMREFLLSHREARGQSMGSTKYAKLSVAYDWLMYGPPNRSSL